MSPSSTASKVLVGFGHTLSEVQALAIPWLGVEGFGVSGLGLGLRVGFRAGFGSGLGLRFWGLEVPSSSSFLAQCIPHHALVIF